MIARFSRLGIQKRVMLYVTVGLVIMFSGFAYVGFRSVQEATRLVYEERLSTAYTTAGVLERDLLHVARDVDEVSTELFMADGERLQAAARSLLSHLSETDPFPFFQVTGVWVLTVDGMVEAVAGDPQVGSSERVGEMVSLAAKAGDSQFVVLPAVSATYGVIPFATVVKQVTDPASSTKVLVAVHTASVNSLAPYVPAAYWRIAPDTTTVVEQQDRPEVEYHMEVLDASGLTVLGIGEDERPGEISRHFNAIQNLMVQRRAAAILHEPSSGEDFKPHVMAVVPLGSSPFYVIMEQATDVALTLPMQLRQRVLMVAMLGFVATLLVAWITTRRIVRPTEQLTAAAQRMAQGDLESPIEVSAQDEVGRLAVSLDAMRQQLRDAYWQISHAKEELEVQVKERTARLAEVLGKVISAQEEERQRLARELHDETAQTIGALSIALDRARYGFQDAPPEAVEQMQEAQAIARHLLEEIRRLILDLRPMVLEDLGLVPAIRWYAETHLQEQGVETTVEVEQLAVRLPPHLEITLFRIVQEAVNNIARHARARQAHIRLLFHDSAACIVVADDGKGFNVERVLGPHPSVQSVGLLGMQERARLLNGRLDIRSEEGKGTQITVDVPIPVEKEQQ
ncbi:MAG: HAMP domain-containing protein [Chloroflexi bacterium]|nr:HAMP domain-containing protein [Chloroflexota bacterium]